MIGPKVFFALAVPLALSLYSLLLNLFVPTFGLISIWVSIGLSAIFFIISIVALIKISEEEEERLISDHMNIRE